MKKLLKIFALSLALALTVPSVNAQLFDEGDIIMSAGIGFGNTLFAFGSLYSTSVPPIWISGDYCLREDLGPGNLGVGGIIGYSAFKSTYNYLGDKYGWKYTTLVIAGRGTYHFTDLVDKLDLYGGVDIGAKILTDKYYGDNTLTDHNALGSGLLVEPFAGARYFFTDNLAGMAELGYGFAVIKLGISFKL